MNVEIVTVTVWAWTYQLNGDGWLETDPMKLQLTSSPLHFEKGATPKRHMLCFLASVSNHLSSFCSLVCVFYATHHSKNTMINNVTIFYKTNIYFSHLKPRWAIDRVIHIHTAKYNKYYIWWEHCTCLKNTQDTKSSAFIHSTRNTVVTFMCIHVQLILLQYFKYYTKIMGLQCK